VIDEDVIRSRQTDERLAQLTGAAQHQRAKGDDRSRDERRKQPRGNRRIAGQLWTFPGRGRRSNEPSRNECDDDRFGQAEWSQIEEGGEERSERRKSSGQQEALGRAQKRHDEDGGDGELRCRRRRGSGERDERDSARPDRQQPSPHRRPAADHVAPDPPLAGGRDPARAC
jgi:hypothetical protein